MLIWLTITGCANETFSTARPVASCDAQAVPLSSQVAVSGLPVACAKLQSVSPYSLVPSTALAHWLIVLAAGAAVGAGRAVASGIGVAGAALSPVGLNWIDCSRLVKASLVTPIG